MTFYLAKIAITTLLIVIVSELAKRSSLAGAIVASIPLVSVLGMFWLYLETKDTTRVSTLAVNVFWLILPSLVLFVTLPLLIKHGFSFYVSISIAIAATVVSYLLMVTILHYFGIRL